MKIRTTPSINASAVGSTAPNYRIIIQEVVKGDNHSYWGRISNGYVCIQDSDNTYMSYTGGLQAHLQQYGDTISFGVKACGYTEEQANAGIGGAFPNNGSNYTMLCSGEWLIY